MCIGSRTMGPTASGLFHGIAAVGDACAFPASDVGAPAPAPFCPGATKPPPLLDPVGNTPNCRSTIPASTIARTAIRAIILFGGRSAMFATTHRPPRHSLASESLSQEHKAKNPSRGNRLGGSPCIDRYRCGLNLEDFRRLSNQRSMTYGTFLLTPAVRFTMLDISLVSHGWSVFYMEVCGLVHSPCNTRSS